MKDSAFASELVVRLNDLLESNPEVRKDLARLFETRVHDIHPNTVLHPTLQVPLEGQTLSPLGLLNGITGAVAQGLHKGQGLITMVCSEHNELVEFVLTEDL